jgi:hypothetical protein
MFSELTRRNALNHPASSALFMLGVLAYLFLLIKLIRFSYLFEIAISLVLPILVLSLGLAKHLLPRVRQLVVIETYYNSVAILTVVSILNNIERGQEYLPFAFVGFFVIQVAGFLAFQVKNKRLDSALLSLISVSMVMAWFVGESGHGYRSAMDDEGRLLMWGRDAPLAVKLVYTFWIIRPLFVDTQLLPKLTQAVVHVASVGLCWWSGEFFHVRLFTACHLLLLDGVLGYSALAFLGRGFCSIPERHVDYYFEKIQPKIGRLADVGVYLTVAGSIVFGLDLGT